MDEGIKQRLQRDHVRRITETIDGWVEYPASLTADLCKSPIEEIFFVAWYSLVASENLHGACCGGWHHIEVPAPDTRLDFASLLRDGEQHEEFRRIPVSPWGFRFGRLDVMMPQYPMGPYVADFLLVRVDSDADGWQAAALAVECDGKQFHDAHAGQVNRDRARDRYFQQQGVPVMRFSGSELYRNFARCADEANGALEASRRMASLHPHEGRNA